MMNLKWGAGLGAVLLVSCLEAMARPAGEVGDLNHFRVEAISLQRGELCLTVDPGHGARISSMTLAGKELMYREDQGPSSNNNWGSTFWLSPQALWGWPPVAAHDSQAYTVTAFDEHRVALTSSTAFGASISKTIALHPDKPNRVDIQYSIHAKQSFEHIAAWEITRVPRNGLAFYPVSGEFLDITMGEMKYSLGRENIVWQELSAESSPPEGKLVANGREGWLAWASEDMLYIKQSTPVSLSDMAKGEGDVEIYVSDKLPYVELELQSAARALQPGEQLDWQVSWTLLPLPEELEVRAGNPLLLDLVREQLSL